MPGIRVLGAYMPEEPVGRHLIKQIGARLGREAKHVLQPPWCSLQFTRTLVMEASGTIMN